MAPQTIICYVQQQVRSRIFLNHKFSLIQYLENEKMTRKKIFNRSARACSLLIYLFSLILIIVIFNFTLMKCESGNDDSFIGYCSTQACERESKNILARLDTSVDACDDFYKHVCGKFIETTKIPDDKTSVDVGSVLDDKLKEQLNAILNMSISPDDIGPFKLSKKLYAACMNKGDFLDRMSC